MPSNHPLVAGPADADVSITDATNHPLGADDAPEADPPDQSGDVSPAGGEGDQSTNVDPALNQSGDTAPVDDGLIDYIDDNNNVIRVDPKVAAMLNARDERERGMAARFDALQARIEELGTNNAPTVNAGAPTPDGEENAFLKRFAELESKINSLIPIASKVDSISSAFETAREQNLFSSNMATVKQSLSKLRTDSPLFKNEHVASLVESRVMRDVEAALRQNPKVQVSREILQNIIGNAQKEAQSLHELLRSQTVQAAQAAQANKGKTVPTATGGAAARVPAKARINYGNFNETRDAVAASLSKHNNRG